MLRRHHTSTLGSITALVICMSIAISALAFDGCAGYVVGTNSAPKGGSGSGALSIASSSLTSGTVGTTYSATLQAIGGTTPYMWSLSSGSLPAGLSLNASSGAISGTPTAAGTSSFTVQVKDASSNTASQSLNIAIAAAKQTLSISTSSLASGTVGTAYSAMLQATGGTTPYSWSITSGSLPPGLSINTSSGAISGTPTAAGTFAFTAKVTDAASDTSTKSLSLTIAALPLAITTTSVSSGSTNTAYSAVLDASGGTTPYKWSISSGALPAGLTLSAAGDIAGVPTTAGTSSFTAKVTDSSSPAQTATATYGVTIAQGTAYSVALAWTASATSGVTGYNIYRTTISGSNYAKINSAPVSGVSYADSTVLHGTTYYYVLTSVDAAGDESGYSTEVQMVIP